MSTPDDTAQLVPVNVPGSSLPMQVDADHKLAAFRPMVEHFGIDYSTQLRKLKGKSWARVVKMTTRDSAGREQEMVGIDRRTTGMWLATLDENRVAEDKRADLRAYQSEAADALDAYFHDGGAINPRVTEHQANALIFQARAQIELCQAAKGLIHPDHLEARARVVLARGLGEHAELDQARRPLYTSDFLKSKNLSAKSSKSIASTFGKRVKGAYLAEHGEEPKLYPLDLPNGQTRDVRAYTEADRPLMEKVWREHYAPLTLDVDGGAA